MPLELLIGAAVGAGLASAPVRKTVRKGVVYTLAGALIAYDKVTGMAANIRSAAKAQAGTAPPKNTAAPAGSASVAEPCPPPASVEPAGTH